MYDWNCDICDDDTYTEENPLVEARTQRPSDHSEMCCVMAGHLKCLGGELNIGETAGLQTPQAWMDWIMTDEAEANGFLFLT